MTVPAPPAAPPAPPATPAPAGAPPAPAGVPAGERFWLLLASFLLAGSLAAGAAIPALRAALRAVDGLNIIEFAPTFGTGAGMGVDEYRAALLRERETVRQYFLAVAAARMAVAGGLLAGAFGAAAGLAVGRGRGAAAGLCVGLVAGAGAGAVGGALAELLVTSRVAREASASLAGSELPAVTAGFVVEWGLLGAAAAAAAWTGGGRRAGWPRLLLSGTGAGIVVGGAAPFAAAVAAGVAPDLMGTHGFTQAVPQQTAGCLLLLEAFAAVVAISLARTAAASPASDPAPAPAPPAVA